MNPDFRFVLEMDVIVQGLLPEVHNEPQSLASTATIHCRQ
jgi:hypothetical protein